MHMKVTSQKKQKNYCHANCPYIHVHVYMVYQHICHSICNFEGGKAFNNFTLGKYFFLKKLERIDFKKEYPGAR